MAIIPLFLYVGGMALTMPCLQLLAMDLFPARHGMASSCQGMIQSVVNAITAGLLAPALWGSTQSLAWGMAGFLCAGGLFFALSVRANRHLTPHQSA
jgi:DHA1 family bicyclomycin/chloramphenicol resistance-like MFS transporter